MTLPPPERIANGCLNASNVSPLVEASSIVPAFSMSNGLASVSELSSLTSTLPALTMLGTVVLCVGPLDVSILLLVPTAVDISPPLRTDTKPCKMVALSSRILDDAPAWTTPSKILPWPSTPELTIVLFSMLTRPPPVAWISPVLTFAFPGTWPPRVGLLLAMTTDDFTPSALTRLALIS